MCLGRVGADKVYGKSENKHGSGHICGMREQDKWCQVLQIDEAMYIER